jgi:hypothetical protein
MSRRTKRVSIILLAVVGFVLLAWDIKTSAFVHDRTLRLRLMLSVKTPEGLRTGSSVIEQTTTFGPFQLRYGSGGWSMGRSLTGEGVVVDLGERGLLVATLVGPDWIRSHGWGGGGGYVVNPFAGGVTHISNPADGLSDEERYMIRLDEIKRQKPKADISLTELPVLIRFSDPNHPTSMSLVDPTNLAGAFGPGVYLETATVEVTDNPITHAIAGQLPWLKQNRLPKFDDFILPLPPPEYKGNDPHPPNFRYSVFLKPQ